MTRFFVARYKKCTRARSALFYNFLLIAWDKMVAMCESTCLTEKLLTKVVKIIFKEEFER